MPKTVAGIRVPLPAEPANVPSDLELMAQDIANLITAMGQSAGLKPPAGLMYPYAGSNAPTGYLLCDGKDVSRTTYGALFAVIGTTYGAGDGTTTFTLPNLKGRVPLGAGQSTAAGATNHPVGQVGGEEAHILTINEMPSHSHAQPYYATNSFGSGPTRYGVGENPSHRTGVEGGNQPHNTLPPFVAVNYLIATGI